jgi:hypothetical protein
MQEMKQRLMETNLTGDGRSGYVDPPLALSTLDGNIADSAL